MESIFNANSIEYKMDLTNFFTYFAKQILQMPNSLVFVFNIYET